MDNVLQRWAIMGIWSHEITVLHRPCKIKWKWTTDVLQQCATVTAFHVLQHHAQVFLQTMTTAVFPW